MGYQMNWKSRKELKNKMATVFSENIKTLSTDLQGVLLDDLVTALENRLNVLKRIHQNTRFVTAITGCAEYETIKT
jgi:carbon monoxide dehydrogenase subunit G